MSATESLEATLTEEFLTFIEAKNAMHGAKVRRNLDALNRENRITVERFLQRWLDNAKTEGHGVEFGVDCYLAVCRDMLHEQVRFRRSGEYSCHSMKDAEERVYSKPEIMRYYMHGAHLTWVFWKQHWEMYEKFVQILPAHAASTQNYLEVGGGHGLFLREALQQFREAGRVDCVDISATSLQMARRFVDSRRVNYIHSDVHLYTPDCRYDWITMGEVLEHVEDPMSLLRKLQSLLSESGRLWITVPGNAPAIDHIYLFRSPEEITAMTEAAGLSVVDEIVAWAEDVDAQTAARLQVPFISGLLLQAKP